MQTQRRTDERTSRRPAGALIWLLSDGQAAAAFRTRFWSGLCFLPLLLILLMFAQLPLTAPWPSLVQATAAPENSKNLAGLLALVLLAFLALEPLRRLRRRGRNGLRRASGMAAALAGTAIVTGTYVAIIGNKAFPVTEGWFVVFAKYVNEGKVPYRDFELLAPPLYTYILAGITAVFGYDLIVLRMVGVVLFVAIAIMACLLFSRLFAPVVAMIAACLTAFYLQSEVANVFYDYIRFFDLFAYAAILCLLVHVSTGRPRRRRWNWALTACGLCSGSALLIRQNSGAILAAAMIVVLALFVLFARPRREKAVDLATYMISMVAPVAVLAAVMALDGSLVPFLEMTTGDALSAKGGVAVVLFGWVGRSGPQVLSQQGSIAFLLGLLLINGALYSLSPRRASGARDGLVWGAVFFTTTLAGVVLCFRSVTLASAFAQLRLLGTPYSVTPIAGLLLVYGLYRLTRGRSLGPGQRRFFLVYAVLIFMILALGYGSATSFGFSEGQSALAMGTIFATLLLLGGRSLGKPAQLVTVTLCLGLCLAYASFKIVAPYYWWGVSEPSLSTATESLTVPLLRGIRVSPSTKAAVEGITGAISASSRPGDDVFVFPHIPVFYLLTDRYPRTFTLVQWFDFSSGTAVLADLRRVEQHPPKVIVIAKLWEGVYDRHESLFLGGGPSAQRMMRDGLERLVHTDRYREVGAWLLSEGCRIVVYAAR